LTVRFKPHSPQQSQALGSKAPIVLLATGIQFGKALCMDELVLTPDGYIPIGSLKVGDVVFDRNGTQTKVVGVFPQGQRQVYRINFTDQKSFISDGEHLNCVIPRCGRAERIMTTEQLFNTPSLWTKARFPAISRPLEMLRREFVISPYVLGVLIGDGSLLGSVSISNPDAPIVERVKDELPQDLMLKQSVELITYNIIHRQRLHSAKGYGRNIFKEELVRLGLFGKKSQDKFVPEIYKYASIDQRLDLLRGLMDTDGGAKKNKYMEFNTSSLKLAHDVIWLVESLAGKAWIRSAKIPKYTYRGEKREGVMAYRVNVILKAFNPFSFQRKAKEYFVHENTTDKVVASVEKLDVRPTLCIKVDSPTETFVAKDQIVTHNTAVGAIKTKMAMHHYTESEDNFIVTSPTYKILSQSTLPPFLRAMDGCGIYHRQDAVFEMYNGGRCYFRTATDPDSIVGITNVRFIYGDEAGLYSLYFWENIQARAAFKNAQILLTTSPYTLNWVYRDLIRPKQKQKDARPDVDYIKARSVDNPYFPKDYYERMRNTMDERRFRAMFGGEWEKMEGLVYDCFNEEENSITPFELPAGTEYYGGIDWGTTAPFAMVIRAITPEGLHFQITEAYKSGLTVLDQIALARQKLLRYPVKMFYADPSMPGHIAEFNRAGIPCSPADNDIRKGIDLHYELVKTRRFKVFRGDNRHTVDEMETYHYPSQDEVDQDTNVTEDKPVKQGDHACFIGATMILTPAGERRIDSLLPGELVLTPLGPRRISHVASMGLRSVVETKLSNGRKLVGTPEHPVHTSSGFIPLASLADDSSVSTCVQAKMSNLTAKLIIGMASIIVAPAAGSIFILKCLRRIMDEYRKVFTSTISTITEQITILPTWKLCPQEIIYGFMGSNCRQNKRSGGERMFCERELLPRRGINPQRAELGTRNMANGPLGKERLNTSRVSSAHLIFILRDLRPVFVRTIVSLYIVAKVVLMTWWHRAVRVVGLSRKTSIHESKPVKPLAQWHWPIKQNVYNLTVETAGCYYANGILSSNCDANRYVTIMTYTGEHRRAPKVISGLRDSKKLTIDERLARIREAPNQTFEAW
jgi:PBSX family phage terminase large subunit